MLINYVHGFQELDSKKLGSNLPPLGLSGLAVRCPLSVIRLLQFTMRFGHLAAFIS